MGITDEQRKILTGIEDTIAASLYAVREMAVMTIGLLRHPSKISDYLIENEQPRNIFLPLTYLAACSFIFIISLPLLPAILSFFLLRNFSSVGVSVLSNDVSVTKCLLAAIPTVLVVAGFAWLLSRFISGPANRRSVTLVVCVAAGFELVLLSGGMFIGRLALATLDSPVVALLALGLFGVAMVWPAACLAKLILNVRAERTRMTAISVSTCCICFAIMLPTIGCGVFLLQYGFVTPFSPAHTCFYNVGATSGQSREGLPLTTVVINRSAETLFLEPPSNRMIVNGEVRYISQAHIGSSPVEIRWEWPEQRVITIDPEKSAILLATVLQPGRPDLTKAAGKLVIDLSARLPSGLGVPVSCVADWPK